MDKEPEYEHEHPGWEQEKSEEYQIRYYKKLIENRRNWADIMQGGLADLRYLIEFRKFEVSQQDFSKEKENIEAKTAIKACTN